MLVSDMSYGFGRGEDASEVSHGNAIGARWQESDARVRTSSEARHGAGPRAVLRFATLAVVLTTGPGAMALAARANDMVQRRALSW